MLLEGMPKLDLACAVPLFVVVIVVNVVIVSYKSFDVPYVLHNVCKACQERNRKIHYTPPQQEHHAESVESPLQALYSMPKAMYVTVLIAREVGPHTSSASSAGVLTSTTPGSSTRKKVIVAMHT